MGPLGWRVALERMELPPEPSGDRSGGISPGSEAWLQPVAGIS
jgi:hypothetical protein